MQEQIDAFLTSLEAPGAYSESTRLAYANDLKVFTGHLRKKLARAPRLDDLTAVEVAEFLEIERQSGRRQSTLRRRRATLRRFVTYLRKHGLVENDLLAPATDRIDRLITSVSPPEGPQCLSADQVSEIKKIIASSSRPRARRDQAILSLLLETGLTVGTLVELDLSDLDLRNQRIRLTPEGDNDVWLPLNSASETLNEYVNEGRPDMNPLPDDHALFVSQMGRRMSRQGIWQILRHWGKRVDPPVDLSPRLVRHTAAMKMSRDGRALNEIQALLGHSNPLSTQALLRRLEDSCGAGA